MYSYDATIPNSQKSARITITVCAGTIFFVGALFLAISLVMGNFEEKKRERCTAEATALVIDLAAKEFESDGEYEASVGYAPVLRFVTENDREYTVFDTNFSYPPVVNKGDSVRVLYDPDDPKVFIMPDHESPLARIFRTVSIGMITVAAIIVAVYLITVQSKKAKADPLDAFR